MILNIENYKITKEIHTLSDNLTLYLAKSKTNDAEYEILVIKYKKTQHRSIERVVNNNMPLLTDSKNTGVQRVFDYGESKKQKYFYIVYEVIGGINNEQSRNNFEQCIEILSNLKNENKEGFALNKDTVFLLNNQIKISFIGLFEVFQKLKFNFDGIENISKNRNIKDDIKSLAKLFEAYLNKTPEKQIIYEKCLQNEYRNYSEIQDDLGNICDQNIGVTVNSKKISSTEAEELIQDLNDGGCYWEVQNKESDQGDILIRWTTRYFSGLMALVSHSNDGYLLVLSRNEIPNDSLIKSGNKAPFIFVNYDNEPKNFSVKYFQDKFNSLDSEIEMDEDTKRKISDWKALPEQEKKNIENKAFNVRYVKRKTNKKNKLKIDFILSSDTDWKSVKIAKKEKTKLFFGDYAGEISWFDIKKRILIIDCSRAPKSDKVQEKGIIKEDLHEKVSQFQKQIQACEGLQEGRVANPELVDIIVNPKSMKKLPDIKIDYAEYKGRIKNQELKINKSQSKAVIDAINKKPIYLIQGPPGTGKTTVIVEIIQQLSQEKSNVKILVVSQSNLAVDNVLKKLNELPEDVSFMRLVSRHTTNKVSKAMEPHLFDTKLKKWIREVEEKSNKNIEKMFPEVKRNSMLSDLFTKFRSLTNPTIQDFQKEYRKGFASSYFRKLFDKCKTIEGIDKIFNDELGGINSKLQDIQKNWLSFIRSATSENKTILKSSAEKMDFQTAFVRTINIFGSTCIHVASNTYKSDKFKFDYMIMDEASKATYAESLVPINMSKNLILIGDHKQLPPIITREKDVEKKIQKELDDYGLNVNEKYGKSLFEYLVENFEYNDLPDYKIMLDTQYRMPRQLGYLISKNIYGGKLKNPCIKNYDKDKCHHLTLKVPKVVVGNKEMPNSVIMIDTSKQGDIDPSDNNQSKNRQNICNVKVIKKTLEKLNQAYVDKESPSVGVIAGYLAQVGLLKKKIKSEQYTSFKSFDKEDINTVDKFQGDERDIIIYDIVRSSPSKGTIGFLKDYRRINVALSRAKKLLIIVGDSDYILNRVKDENEKIVIKEIIKQLAEWNCIYDSLEGALK